LFEPDPVAEAGVDVSEVESPGEDGNSEYGDCEDGAQPEGAFGQRHTQRADIRPLDRVVVRVIQDKIEQQRTPHCDVVKNRPVAGIHGNLK